MDSNPAARQEARGDGVAAAKFVHGSIGVFDRFGIRHKLVISQVGYPVLVDSQDSVECQLHCGVVFQRRIGDFNNQEDICGAGVLASIEIVLPP